MNINKLYFILFFLWIASPSKAQVVHTKFYIKPNLPSGLLLTSTSLNGEIVIDTAGIAGTGTVTSVDASGGTTGFSFTGGPITGSGILTMSGVLSIANGGTNATTANTALNNLLPNQSGHAGQFLITDGTNASWAIGSGTGSNFPPFPNDTTVFLRGDSTWAHIPTSGGGSGGLRYWTDSLSTASPNNTRYAIALIVDSNNTDAVIQAGGTGATLAQMPDAGTTGGDKRGIYATDWQKLRSSSSMVASGNYSTIAGGQNNYAAATSSFIGGGNGNIVSGNRGTVAGGTSNEARGDAFVGGGSSNYANAAAVVGGGSTNRSEGDNSGVLSGNVNTASGDYSSILGGENNAISSAKNWSSIIGGRKLTLGSSTSFGFNATNTAITTSAGSIGILNGVDLWLANNDNSPRALFFYEAYNSSGAFPNTAKHVSFKAPTSTTASQDYVLPLDYPATSGYVLSSDLSGVLSWVAGGGGGSDTLAVGDPVLSANPYEIFNADASGNLAQISNTGNNGKVLRGNGSVSPTFATLSSLGAVIKAPTATQTIAGITSGVVPLQLKGTGTVAAENIFDAMKQNGDSVFSIDSGRNIQTYHTNLNFNTADQSIGLYNGVSVNYGTAGQALVSQGYGATPIWSTIGGGVTGFANPTALIGMSTINGAATTAMRSDAAPRIDPAINPTWTGIHGFSDSVGSVDVAQVNLQTSASAHVGAQEYSPFLSFAGAGWKTNATAGSEQVIYRMGVRTVQGTTHPTGLFAIESFVAGGSYIDNLTLSNSGVLTLGSPLQEGSGGTHQTTYATGDLLYASASNTLSKLPIGSTGDVLAVSGGVPTWTSASSISIGTAYFGDGSDGSVTFDGSTTILGIVPSASTYTLARDVFCSSITINSGVIVKPNGFRIFCTGTLTNVGTIHNDGNNASGGSGGGSTNINGAIGAGRNGKSAAGGTSNGVAGDNAYGFSAGGNGGNGGAAGANVGATGGVATAPSDQYGGSQCFRNIWTVSTGFMTSFFVSSSAGFPAVNGGAGGALGACNGGGNQAGSASGGGVVLLNVYAINNSGRVSADGGIAGSATAVNAGGSGGGGGGVVFILTHSYTNSGIISANGGLKSAPTGTGSAGTDGSAGKVIVLTL